MSARGARIPVLVPAALVDRMAALARASGATLFMALLAIFGALLGRHSGQERLVVGGPTAGRSRPEVERLLGCFINTVVFGIDLRGDPSFRELLGRARRTALAAFEHMEISFERVVDALVPERDLSRPPLVQAVLVTNVGPAPHVRIDDLEFSGLSTETETSKFELTLELNEAPEGLIGALEYATDLFTEETASRVAQRFVRLFEAAVNTPDEPMSSLSCIGDAEAALLSAWSSVEADYPRDALIHELFEERARESPSAIAVEYEDQSLTYGELDARANQLSHWLRALGVGPEVRVALCVERSLEMVVGLLAILKAGGAYVPLDPDYPSERMAFMMADARAAVLLTQSSLKERLPAREARVIYLDAGAALWSERPRTAPKSFATAENLAYILFTSGSTGVPKGVAVPHRGVVRLVREANYASFHRDDIFVQLAPLAFDASTLELWAPLLNGAKLVVHRRGPVVLDELAEALVRRRVTTLWLTAGLFHSLVDVAPESLRGVRQLLTGGDVVSPTHARLALGLTSGALVNGYGPTENTTFTACHRVELSDTEGERVPIGVPVSNTSVYVLDVQLRQVPVGVAGEIYAAGDGLARGYQGRPGLTAERFVPNPFSATPGARLYRTGDRARWTDRGRLDFLGRLDQQVKIRGFRIELAEIEGCLGRHPAVGQAVVAAREDSPGEKRLVAYLVARLDVARPTALELREHLKRSLPDSMIPAAFLWLDAVPLTARGKVDRRALPAPEGSREGIGTPYLEPRSELEGAIAGVFAEVLRMPRVSVLDGFFALGGDSILAIQIVSRLRRAGIHVSPRDIFEHPTAAKLAQVAVRAAAGVAAQEAAVGAALLTPIQRRFFDAEPIEPHHFNQALLWNVSTALTPDIVSAALEACLRQHDALRLRYRRSDAGWLQEHASEASWPLARLDLSTVEPQERPKALEVFADALHAGLSLSSGPLARAAWIDRGEAGAQLLLVIHHLVVDGVSWRALHEDLESAARSFVSSQEPSLGPKTVSFQAWSERLHRWVAEGGLDDEIPYWQAECARPIPALPLDRAAPLGAEGELRVAEIALSEQETRSLIRDAGAAYHTEINDLLLAALADALRAFWGVDNVCVGLEGHGREPPSEDLDISRTVGWFTSLFPVWLHVPRGGGKGALIKEIKERLRRIPRRGFGYGWLRYAHSDPAVRASLSQDPPVVFNYLGQIDIETNAQRHFSAADGPTGAAVSPRASAREALSISGAIWRARLRFGFRYSPRVHDEATIQRLAERFRESLVELINHTCSGEAFGYTPSDFPSARLDQATLDRWIGDVRGVEAIYPLSPLQVGMLFHALRDPESPTYTVQLALEVGAEVDIDALAEAWRRVIARHAVYRTYFVWQDVPEPLQVVLRDVPFAIDRYDLSSLSSDAADARWEAILREDRLRPFDFSRAPLLRITCARFPGGRTWLLKTEHHILSDGWSGPLVLGEVQAIYRGIRAGVIPRMPDPAPYERYIAWLSRRDRAASEAFFRRYLRGVTEPSRLLLPAPDGAPTGAPHENSTLVVDLSPDETAQISTFAKRHGLTVNTALQGALSILLAQRAGRSDVVLGVVTSGRSAPVPGIEQMVGLFINTVPLRARFGPSDRVAPWLSSLQADQVDVRVHEATPLWDVQRLSEIPGYQPLFDTLLVFENYPVPEAAASDPSLPFLRWRSFDQTSYPLTVAAFLGSSLTVKLAWEPAALRRADVERLGAELKALLIRFASSPDERLHGLPLLTEAEDADSIAWSGASAPYPASKCVHELVEEQVDRRPDKVAVEFGDERLTYAALDARSNRLARYLRARGVGPEVRVAQYADRSIEMVIGALAILKAGGVYVPLDPDQPNERLSYIAGDSGAALLLAQRSLLRDAPAVDVPVVELDAEVTVASAQAEERFPSPSGPGNAAYIIYTSGTTGRPKGVLVEHRGLCNFIVMLRDACQVVSDSRVLQMARFGFDASLSELFRTLTAGATLHVATREQTLPGPGLLALLRDQRISVVTLTPTVLAALPSGALPDLRTIISGGEACSAALVDRWAHGRLFFNVYGPTEITICATIALCSPGRGAPPIGRPLPNYRAYVLDPALRPVPRGVIGELCIGGVGVARGYLNRPALTAERFMPDPFSLEAGARMYRTGDFARRRDDGQIEFLGRRDHQVKIRGIRVELGEIEAALVSYPAVRACAVLARKDNPGEIRLVAYVIPGEGDCSSAAMRRHLRASLPEVMVPSAFVRLASLPLTSTGKIDRNALPAPESAQPEDERAYVAPRSPDEERLAAIWAELLRVDRVGVFDNFFDRGGNSILAIQVVGRARRAGISLAVKHLFERPTIAALAAAAVPVEARAEEAGVSGLVPLTPIQRLFFERGSPEPHHFNQAILLKVEGDLREDLLEQALNAVLSHHDAFRLRYRRDGSAIVQSYAVVGEPLSLRRVDLSAAPAEAFDEAIDAASTEIQVSLDLERGPLIRAALFALGPGRSQRLLLVAHHLVVDGVSWRVLLEDLRDLHDQLARGEAPRLPPKTTSFQRFALRLVDFARSESIEGQLAFWRSMREAARLPTDRALGPNTVASSRDVDVELGIDETRALLRGLGQARTARVNAVFLTALMCAISPWIGARRLRINLEGHGREDIGGELDVSRTVGWFTTVFPVELELPEGAPSRALDVIQDQLDRIPHRGIGYGLLRYLHPDPAIRDELQATPGADVVFNYLGELDTSLPEGGLFAIAREPSGRAQSPKAVRGHVLEVNTLVVQGRLKAHFTYSENLHERGTIEALSRRFLHALRDILAGVGAVEPCLPWLASSARAPHGAGSVPRAAWSPLLQLQASGRGRPFFCVHAISGTAIHYSTLASRVGRDRPFYGLQARGLEVGEAPITRLDEMVAEYVEAVRRAQPSGPYLVGGYSFGAIVAYEMARRLLDLGERVASLVLIDPLSPHTEASFAEQSRQPSLDDLFREDGLALPPRALEALAPDEQRRRLIDIARRFNRALPGMDDETVLRVFSLRLATRLVAWRYMPRPYGGPITILRARKGSPPRPGRNPVAERDPARGWSALTPFPVHVHDVPGDHDSLFDEENIQELADKLRACLLAADPLPGEDDS